jgi:hypothetical protein
MALGGGVEPQIKTVWYEFGIIDKNFNCSVMGDGRFNGIKSIWLCYF